MRFSHSPSYPSRRSAVLARNVVATSQPLATEAGIEMLRRGGNALDAALAAAIALTQVEPTGCGIGSDAFAILWDGADLHGLNASGRAPTAWTPERFAGGMPERGWDTVTVPGAVSAWVTLSERFGRLPFEALFEPAIRYAERGFHVSPVIARQWALGVEALSDQPGFEHFMPEGRAPRAGELFTSPEAAATLRLIAGTRGEAFYRGELAKRIADHAAEHGGAMTADDLAAHEADWCGTISGAFDAAELHEIPPNGQGLSALMALGMLRHTSIRDHAPDSAEAMHLMWEAMKLAFRDAERFVADAEAMEAVTPADLLDADYLAARAALIDEGCAQDFGHGQPSGAGTVCLAAADEGGMMVSFIQSNYDGFGSGVVVPGTGIHLQNRGCGFTLEEGHPNRVGPRKRPFHTIIPGFVMRDGAPLMAFGLMGGMMQAQGHVQMVLRTQLWRQDVQTAADAPRWRVLEGRDVACEAGMDEATLERLAAMGHSIVREAPGSAFGFGGAQLVHRVDGGYAAGSDPRKDGAAAGF